MCVCVCVGGGGGGGGGKWGGRGGRGERDGGMEEGGSTSLPGLLAIATTGRKSLEV